MVTLSWDESQATGDALIDRQHREIIQLVNDLPALEGASSPVFMHLLDHLMDHALLHFLAEEELMAQAGFPEILAGEMRAAHDEFRQFARTKVIQFRTGEDVDTLELRKFLEEWVSAHMEGPDKVLCAWIRAIPEHADSIARDLRVHQIELEMQNDELLREHLKLEAARQRYIHLFDNAPVGYITLDVAGSIVHANLTAASLLGVERSSLIGEPFYRHMPSADADVLYLRLRTLHQTAEPQSFELSLRSTTDTAADQFEARVEMRVNVTEETDAPSVLVTFSATVVGADRV